jgi:hypothetical protein
MPLRVVLTIVAATGLAAAAPAWATAPVKGGRYTGKTPQGFPVTGRVTSNGKSLQMRFRDRLRCDDGSQVMGTSTFRRQAPGIKADGTIAYFKRYSKLPAVPAFPKGSRQLQRVTGAFANGGRTVRLRVAETTIGYGDTRTCKLVVSFTLRLKG